MATKESATKAKAQKLRQRDKVVLSRLPSLVVVVALSSCQVNKVDRELLWCVGACIHFKADYEDFTLQEIDLSKLRKKIEVKD